jgi:DNA-binding LacI/PurR family transcriptional regulator
MTFPHAPKFKHREIYEQLHAAILSGRYAAGQRLPTDCQLMRKYQTSRPTVARAMRDLESDGLLERRPGAGSFVRLPAIHATTPLGMLVPSLNEMQIFAPICGEIARTVERRSFHLHLAEIDTYKPEEQMQQAREVCRRFVEQKVIGVFFAPMEFSQQMEAVNSCVGEMLDEARIAVVLLDCDLELFPKRSKFDLVGVDNHRIGYVQTEHLLGLGCRHIEYLAVPLSRPTVEARMEGFRQALRCHGVRCKESWVHRGDPCDREFVGQLAKDLPEAIICANDFTAANLMRSLHGLGIRVPDDVRVVGVDDDKYASLVTPPLTTIRQPGRELGAAAVSMMMERIENRKMSARTLLLDCTLVVRESCGSHRKHRAADNGEEARPPRADEKEAALAAEEEA